MLYNIVPIVIKTVLFIENVVKIQTPLKEKQKERNYNAERIEGRKKEGREEV